MTAHPPLPVAMVLDAVPWGIAGSMVEDGTGGAIYLHGQMAFSWASGDEARRRGAAAKLAQMKAAGVGEIAAAFDVTPSTVWLRKRSLAEGSVIALVPKKKGTK